MHNLWYQRHLFCYILWPFSCLYRFVIFIRRLLYRIGIFKSHRVNAPVIVVGNMTVGGTGKTPLVIALTQALKKQGLHPGIILRGFRGKSKTWPQTVTASSDPVLVGDEAVLLAMKTNVPVMAGPNRALSAKKLMTDYACDIIVSDDGLQHYALARDIEIAVIDGSRRAGNGFCLPAGPLREPLSRLKWVDFLVVNGKANNDEFEMQFVLTDIVNLCDPTQTIDAHDCQNKKVLAIAGIGNPNRFFDSLRLLHFSFETKIFSDHYFFHQKDFNAYNADVILMTEKDAVKCRDFADSRFYVVRGQAILPEQFYCAVVRKMSDR